MDVLHAKISMAAIYHRPKLRHRTGVSKTRRTYARRMDFETSKEKAICCEPELLPPSSTTRQKKTGNRLLYNRKSIPNQCKRSQRSPSIQPVTQPKQQQYKKHARAILRGFIYMVC